MAMRHASRPHTYQFVLRRTYPPVTYFCILAPCHKTLSRISLEMQNLIEMLLILYLLLRLRWPCPFDYRLRLSDV